MGREWYWGGGGGGRSTKKGGDRDSTTPSGCMSAVLQLFDFHQFQFALHHQPSFNPDSFLPEEPTILKGVEAPRNSLESEEPFMGASSLPSIMKEEDNLNIPMGIQIRTSTTSGDTRTKVLGASKAKTDDLSSESSCSPGTKTPNLVARLMGLDLLPDSLSPSSSSSTNHGTSNPLGNKSHPHHLQAQILKLEFRTRQPLQSRPRSTFFDTDVTGTRSLPETPRISSARRSDVDPRLSLQINKENVSISEELEFSSTTARRKEVLLKREDQEMRSPSHYARQIVKQVKESVSRKVGLDITNTIRSSREQGKNELASTIKSKKTSKAAFTKVNGDGSSPSKHTTPSCSPRLRFLEAKNKPLTTSPKDQTSHPPPKPPSSLSSASVDNQSQSVKILSKPKSQPLHEQQQQQRSIKKCNKAAGERFGSRLKKTPQISDRIRNKQEEPFVRPSTASRANISDNKCKKTPLSNDLLNINVPTLILAWKDPSPSTTKVPQKQSQVPEALSSKESSQLSSCSSQMYKQKATHMLADRDSSNDRFNGATTTGGGAEFQYVTRILKRTGIDRGTPVSFIRWFSPSHPLDPSIFHHLEHSFSITTTATTSLNDSQLSRRCNRKLLFHLVDEILVEILKPYINMRPWISPILVHDHQMQGSQLIDTLCSKIRSFPTTDCRVLEDIDALIDKDLPESQLRRLIAFEEEGEAIVSEIEGDIVDSLVHETAAFLGVAVPVQRGPWNSV